MAGAFVVALAACGGSGPAGGVTPTGGGTAPQLTISIRIPAKATGSQASKRPAYVSPATQSMTVAIETATGQSVANQTINLTPSSPGCSATTGATECSTSIPLAPGSYVTSVSTFSGPSGSGSVLSENQRTAFTVQVGQANNLALALYGVPVSIVVTPSGSAFQGTQASGFTMSPPVSLGAQSFTVSAADASGDTIVGQGAPTFTVTSSSSAVAVSTPNPADPNEFTLTLGSIASTTATISIAANPGDATACSETGATCSTTFATNYLPFENDDWITFAHDFARTGRETQSTGITEANVGQLQKRWQITLPNNEPIYASPVVYDGNVIVTGYSGNVYELSAQDGHIVWETHIGGASTGTPTIDASDGLVFAGQRHNTATVWLPSNLYALQLSTGAIVWQAQTAGLVRSPTVYANGMVYAGISGGDAPECFNGGVDAFNAKTGAQVWQWLVNPETNPGGGGGVWGAIAYDGKQLIFGTGNACIVHLLTSQGAVSLNPQTGAQNWSFVANSTSDDDDTGGGVLIQNGLATFINKNGTLYTSSSSTGAVEQQQALGAADGNGGFASPTSDGSITIIGAGLFPVASTATRAPATVCLLSQHTTPTWRHPSNVVPGFTSKLVALDAAGNVLWTHPMQSRLSGYVAIDGEIAFAGLDTTVTALDVASGSVLWTFNGQNLFEAAPVVVPSGVYAADWAGNVYAFGLPAGSQLSTTVIKRK